MKLKKLLFTLFCLSALNSVGQSPFMKSKTFAVFRGLILLLLFASISTSCCENDTFNVSISGLETRPFIFDGNSPVDVNEQTPIDKEDLVIDLILTEVQTFADNNYNKKNNSGVEVLEAAVVPCGDDEFIFVNKVESITVVVINPNSNESIDITDQVFIFGTDQSISEIIPENTPGQNNFLLQLADTSNIPNPIEYIIEATLDDGSIISSTGGIINFN